MQELSEQQRQEEVVVTQPQQPMPQPVYVVEPTPIVVEEIKKPVVEQPKKDPEPTVILEAPKKKRKQQVFYEIKIHSTPKLTRADLEK